MSTTPSDKPPGRPPAYPFASLLGVGDSFTFTHGKGRSVRSAACAWVRRNNPRARFRVRGDTCTRIE